MDDVLLEVVYTELATIDSVDNDIIANDTINTTNDAMHVIMMMLFKYVDVLDNGSYSLESI